MKKKSLKLSWKKGVKADHMMQRSVSWILCKCLKKQKERLKTTITYEQKNYYYSLFAANISTHRWWLIDSMK